MRIYVLPLGAIGTPAVSAVEEVLRAAFEAETCRLEPAEEPEDSHDAVRHQYSSIHIMRDLVKRVPDDADRLLVLTEKDIFIPMLSFIYGQAQLGGTTALVSLARLRQEFYGLPPNEALLHARLRKESIHETGHTFGLVHCLDRTCPMSLSTSILQLDTKGNHFCAGCAVILQGTIHREHAPGMGVRLAETNR